MSDEAGAEDLIDAIYDAGFGSGSWPVALTGIVAALGAKSACFSVSDVAGKRTEMLPIGIDPRIADDYTQHYARIDPFVPALLAAAAGRAHDACALISRDAMERSETYCEWAVPNGMREASGIVLRRDAARTVVLAVMRARRGDAFSPGTLRRFERLAGHVRRALGIQQRLGADGGRSAALDRLSDGVFLVDRAARVLHANRAGEDMLADAGGLRTEGGVLAGRRPADSVALHALMAGGGALRLPRSGRPPLGVVVAPLPSGRSPFDGVQPAAFVFVSDPERRAVPPIERLRTLFGLTPMQAAFAREIVRGDGIDAAAARLGVSRATARAHLSQIFAKTKTSRQAELVRTLLRCAPDLREE